MSTVFEKILELEDIAVYSKHDRIVQGVINAIDDKVLQIDDILPSVNIMIRNLKFSRETIMKGYRELVDRGLVESKYRQGYFVSNNKTVQVMKCALVMYNLDTFEEQFYRNFRQQLGKNVDLNTFFHHGNIDIFETILQQIRGKFGMYVVAPIPNPRTKELVNSLPRNKFIMFDRYEEIDGEFNHITQEFEKSSYQAFKELLPQIRKFDEIIFFHSPQSLDPKEIPQAFNLFLKENKVKGRIIKEFIPGSVEKGKIYFTLDNFVMWEIMKECKKRNFKPGKDVGVLSHNDEPAKEIVGITTYSTDFAQMGRMVGQAVMDKQSVQITVPTVLARRNTL